MKCTHAILALALAFVPALARAQNDPAVDSGMDVSIDGIKQDAKELWLYLNAADCADNVEFKFSIEKTLSAAAENLEIWHGPEKTECWKGVHRKQADTGDADCTQVLPGDYEFDASRTPTATGLAQDLFPDEENKCGNLKDRWLYVMSLETPTTTGETAPKDATAGNYFRVKLTIDTALPAAPTEVEGAQGESSIDVDWVGPDEINADVARQGKYRIYYFASEVMSTTVEGCASTKLVAGEAPPTGMEATGPTTSNEGASFSPSEFGLTAFNTKVPIAVTSIDPAGNESVLSAITCVAKVEVDSFLDACNMSSDCQLETCSAAPWSKATSALSVLMMIACSAAFARRRRRNV